MGQLSRVALYVAHEVQDPGDLLGPSILLRECVSAGSISVASPGWWYVVTLDQDGNEVSRTDPVLLAASGDLLVLPTPAFDSCTTFRYAVYKNPDPSNQNGIYDQVLLLPAGQFAFEIMTDAGCYRLQAVTERGVSELSTPICRDQEEGCCPQRPCSSGYAWDPVKCSCYPDPFSGIAGPVGIGCVNTYYFSTLTGLNASGPFTWTLLSGSLPPGLTLLEGTIPGNTTTLSGTPTTTGNYTFTVKCTDALGTSFEATFTIYLLGIIETTLTDACTDTAYSSQLTAGGGIGPYTFSVISGALPEGITLSSAGLISGTPNHSGTYNFTIQVMDSVGQICDTDFVLEVASCPASPIIVPVIAGEGDHHIHSAYDHQRRILWLPDDFNNNPFQYIRNFDGAANSFLTRASDTNGLLNPVDPLIGAKCDLGNGEGRCLIDTKYNQAIFIGNQSWWSCYDLDSRNLLALTKDPDLSKPKMYCYQPCYDSSRGLVYLNWYLGTPLRIYVWDCHRSIRGFVADYTPGTNSNYSNQLAYVPETDTVYIANVDGPNLFHKWNPATHAFTLNQCPGYGASFDVRYIRGLGFLVFFNSSQYVFVDPLTDAVVGTYASTEEIKWVEGNTCDPTVFWIGNTATATNHIRRFVYTAPSTFSETVVGTDDNYDTFHFDEDGKKLIANPHDYLDIQEYAL